MALKDSYMPFGEEGCLKHKEQNKYPHSHMDSNTLGCGNLQDIELVDNMSHSEREWFLLTIFSRFAKILKKNYLCR